MDMAERQAGYRHSLNISISLNFSQRSRNVSNDQSQSTELDPYDSFLRSYETIPRFLYYEAPIVVFGIGIILNIMLLTYLIKAKKYKSPLFVLVTSLCVSDLIMCICSFLWPIFLFPMMVVSGSGFVCPVVMYLTYVTNFLSTYHLVFFSVMRFYQLCYPLQARSLVTAGRVFRVCVCISIVCFTSQIPFATLYSKMQVRYREQAVYICAFSGDYSINNIVGITLCVLIPFITICFFHIYKHLKVSMAKLDVRQERMNTDARAVTIVLLLFFVAWSPALFHDASHEYFNAPQHSFHFIIFQTASHFGHSNSALNPLVYSLASKSIRKDLLRTLFPCKACRK